MLGLLRTAVAAGVRAEARLPAAVTNAKVTSLPFVPTDWVFRFFPYICRDRVRFMLRFNQISFMMGFGYFYFWCHTPFKCDHYDGFYESPLYKYVRGSLERSGKLEENLRVKVHHFYPQQD
mmetsp:Transcript_88410/g.258404  ORF Transcript_88410/g.258404 Transcript_88410/m.258404 type:complete len:121 (-) Transcript_88410:159-521(-)